MRGLIFVIVAYFGFADGQVIGIVSTLAGGNGATSAGNADGVGTVATFYSTWGCSLGANSGIAIIVRGHSPWPWSIFTMPR